MAGTTRLKYDLTGKRFGRILVKQYAGIKGAAPSWVCRCDCGTEKVIASGNLRSGRVVSCGCYHSDELRGRNRLSKRPDGASCEKGHFSDRKKDGTCKTCDRDHHRAFRLRNPDKIRDYARGWRESNVEVAREYCRKHKRKDPERFKALARERAKMHPEKATAKETKRRAAKIQRLPAWADQNAIALMYRVAQIAKVTWPETRIHVDHEIPLLGKTVSGLHVHQNLRVLAARENLLKSNRFEVA